jgi:hypothetical protein
MSFVPPLKQLLVCQRKDVKFTEQNKKQKTKILFHSFKNIERTIKIKAKLGLDVFFKYDLIVNWDNVFCRRKLFIVIMLLFIIVVKCQLALQG